VYDAFHGRAFFFRSLPRKVDVVLSSTFVARLARDVLIVLSLTLVPMDDCAAAPPSAVRIEVRLGRVDAGGNGWPAHGRLIVVLGKPGDREPRLTIGQTGMDAPALLGADVANLAPTASAVLDDRSTIFPVRALADLKPGKYAIQAVLHTNRDLNFPNAPGDLFSPVTPAEIGTADGAAVIRLELTGAVPAETLPADTGQVRFIKIRSKRLSDFHGRPIDLRAGVILPRDFERSPDRRYPLRIHIGGYGARFTDVLTMMAKGHGFERAWMSEQGPRFVLVHLDGAGPLGDPYQVDSANHGPYGAAVTEELIPFIESTFRGIGRGDSRVVDGGSTGGWVALALQIFYPDFFNGAWSFCPDSVDFRSFQLIDIYDDANAYVNRHGFERPSARDVSGEVRYTMRHECGLENVLGLGGTWTLSGAQWGAWNATYGARGADGLPVPLWDPVTGAIDRQAALHYRGYDLREILERNWQVLGPRLAGKLHIWVGEADDYFLNNAVHRLDRFLSNAAPAYGGSITYGPGQGHCWMGISEREMMRQMASRAEGASTAPAAGGAPRQADGPNPGD
jgi:hypothetical protein